MVQGAVNHSYSHIPKALYLKAAQLGGNRRFFRTASGTGSRTEVVADKVVPAGQKSRVRSIISSVAKMLGS